LQITGTNSGQNDFSFCDTSDGTQKEKKMFPTQTDSSNLYYLPPVLREGKETYVEFYALYPPTGKLRRKRIKLNRIQNKSERRKYGRKLCAEISAKLICGWNPFYEAIAPRACISARDAVNSFLTSKQKTCEPASMASYRSMAKLFLDWLNIRGHQDTMPIAGFTEDMAKSIMLSIEQNPKVSYRTYGNRLRYHRILFAWLKENGYVAENPFQNFKWNKRKAASQKIRRMLSSEEKHLLLKHLEDNGYHTFLAMCLICYYCFMRDKEICLLRVGDIDLKRQFIRVSGEIAKNDHASLRTIPDVLLPYLKRLRLDAPADHYLFADGEHYEFTPGKKAATTKTVYKFWAYHVRKPLGWGTDLSFYSLKETGITDITSAGVPLNFVQGQADHSNISITSVYLSSQTPAGHVALKKVDTF